MPRVCCRRAAATVAEPALGPVAGLRLLSPIELRLQSLRTCQNALDVLELGLAEGVSEDSLCPDMEFADILGETVASESEA